MITITLSNQKGGVAKTTTAQAIAAGLTHRGKKVLAVDLDPQCNFSLSSGLDLLNAEATIYDIFKKSKQPGAAVVKAPLGYDMLPGGLELAGADMDFTQQGREYMLREALQQLSSEYDFAVIDTPPTLGILTVNALTASDGIVIPVNADVYSIQGLSQLAGLINANRRYCNADLKEYGLLLTKFNGRQTVSKAVNDMLERAAEQLGTQVFKTRIRESVAVREAELQQQDFFTESPQAKATQDYNSFLDELLEVINNGNK